MNIFPIFYPQSTFNTLTHCISFSDGNKKSNDIFSMTRINVEYSFFLSRGMVLIMRIEIDYEDSY